MSKKFYYLFNKPYGVLCQFTDAAGRRTLKDFGPFPPDVYSVGRLDMDSEGLLLLTNDHELNHRFTDPHFGHLRTYLVQVEGTVTPGALARLRSGVSFQGKSTRPAGARLLESEPALPPRIPPIRYRKNIPTSWIEITLSEGRNRQVRKMTASVGFPALRLVRIGFGGFLLGEMKPGEVKALAEGEVEKLRRNAMKSTA